MQDKKDFSNILAQLKALDNDSSLPPVEQWDPEFCGDMDLVIKRDGLWYYQGTPIGRLRLVKLFSTILKKEDNNFYLVTPVEKLGIKVQDAPFLVTSLKRITTELGELIQFTDNCDNEVLLTKDNPIWVELDEKTAEPSPYINIRSNLDALIHRNVFYELVEMAEERRINNEKHLGVVSAGEFFSLGSF